MQPGPVEGAGQRLDAERGDQRVRRGVVLDPQHGAEAARIAQPQRPPAEDDVEVIVPAGRFRRRHQAQAARHAQMHDQRSMVEAEQQVFAAAVDAAQAASGEQAAECAREGIAQAGMARHDGVDAAPGQVGQQAAAGDFDLGQFGHGGFLQVRRGSLAGVGKTP